MWRAKRGVNPGMPRLRSPLVGNCPDSAGEECSTVAITIFQNIASESNGLWLNERFLPLARLPCGPEGVKRMISPNPGSREIAVSMWGRYSNLATRAKMLAG